MIENIWYNYRTSSDGRIWWDSLTLGDEYDVGDDTGIITHIWVDGRTAKVEISAENMTYVLTVHGVHQIIEKK